MHGLTAVPPLGWYPEGASKALKALRRSGRYPGGTRRREGCRDASRSVAGTPFVLELA